MARKSGWQEFAENFQGVYGTFKQIGQDVETSRIMDDEKFMAGAGKGLSGGALDKARYKALGDIYTKYGNAKEGLAMRQSISTLEASERKNELDAATLQEQIKQNGLLKSALMQSQAYQNNASGNNSNASADQKTTLTPAMLAKYEADTESVMDGNYRANQKLPGEILQQDATLQATLAGVEKTGAETDQITQLLPGKVADQLADLNLTTAQTNRIETLLSGEKALQGQQLATAIANMGLTEANTKRVLDLLPGQIQAQTDASASVNAATAGQVLSNEADQAAAAIRDMETGFLTQINDPTFRADNNIETEEDAQAALIRLYKSSNIPIERQMAVETALTKHGIGKLQNVAVETAQAAKNELQKGGLAGVIKWYDGVDDGDATSLNTRVVDGVYELFSSSGTGENRTETVLHSGASEAELEAKLMGQITNPGSGLEIAASILEMRSTAATIDNKDAQTQFTLENTKGLAGSQAYTQAQLDLANVKAREIRAELRQKYTKEGKAELQLQRDQKALDKFLTDNLPLIALDDTLDADALVQQFLTSRQQSTITFDPAD
jgi:hypothetical protein